MRFLAGKKLLATALALAFAASTLGSAEAALSL